MRISAKTIVCKEQYRIFWVLAGVLLTYLISFPGNRHENDDGYSYAIAIRDLPFHDLYNSRYLLFLPFSKGMWLALSNVGIALDPYLLMCFLSLFFSLLMLYVFYLVLTLRLKMETSISIIGCLLLAVCYGYWRYSVEAEVYAVSNFMVVLTFYYFFPPANGRKYKGVLTAAVIGAVAVLFYKPNFISVFIAFPVLFCLRRDVRGLIVYLALGGLLIVTGYYICYSLRTKEELAFVPFLMGGTTLTSGRPLLSMLVLTSDIVASNFIYGFDAIALLIHRHFPMNRIEEEVFAAKRNTMFNKVALATLGLLIWVFLNILFKRITQVKVRFPDSLTWLLISWVSVYSIILGFLDPSSPEPWLMILVPLSMLFLYTCLNPLVKQGSKGLPVALVCILFFHNFVGGYKVIEERDSDYNYYQTRWLINHAHKSDLVVTLGSYTTLQYILYFSAAGALNPEQNKGDWQEKIQLAIAKGRRIFFDEEFMHPRDVVRFRNPLIYQQVLGFVHKFKNQIYNVNPNGVGGPVYALKLPH